MPQLTRNDVLVVFALRDEAQHLFDDGPAVFCGVGKVNASYHLTRAIYEWQHKNGQKPKLVLNLGSAGSARYKTGEVINCHHFIQRDMDTTIFGGAPYSTVSDDTPIILDNGLHIGEYQEGICGSGDSFVTNPSNQLWTLVDMESYALARICYWEHLPFACYKYITDGADDKAATTWENNLASSAQILRKCLDTVLSQPLP